MKRLPVLVAALAVAATGATVAEAALKKGSYAGATSAGDPVGLKIDSKGRVYAFSFADVHLKCSDGDEFDSGDPITTPHAKRYKVTKGKFKIRVRQLDASRGWDVTGKFASRGKVVGGRFTVFANFDEGNNPDPNGASKCTSGVLRWSARRK